MGGGGVGRRGTGHVLPYGAGWVDVGIGLHLPPPPPLLYSLLYFNTQLLLNSQYIKFHLQNDLPAVFRRPPRGRVFALHSTAVGNGGEDEVVGIISMSRSGVDAGEEVNNRCYL